MTEASIHIGVLSPATPDRPHFKSLDAILPPGVVIAHEGLGLLGESYQDLAGKSDRILELAQSFVQRHHVSGVMITGGFVTLFNPGLEERARGHLGLPVVSAVSSAVTALKTFAAKSVLLMTPFDAASDAVIQAHITDLGFTVTLGPAFEHRKAGAALTLSRNELFDLVDRTFHERPAQAIYFQGATMDPLPILQRLEDALSVPVITSNSAMLWNLLTTIGHRFSIDGYGRLLKEWPGKA